MAKLYSFLLGVLIMQLSVSAAPSEVEKIEDFTKVDEESKLEEIEPKLLDKLGTKLDGKTLPLVDEESDKSEQSQRQKRWYNPLGYPPANPVFFESFGKRDQNFNTGYEYNDPFVEIHRRLLDISNVVRQSPPPPPPQFPPISTSQFPFYLPVFYVPQIGCSCPPQIDNSQVTPNPDQENNTLPVDNEKNITMPDGVENRFPVLDDPRQNFGLVINETDPDDEGDDVGRPISFDPIQPDKPMVRPPPPVEHGSSQGSVNDGAGQPGPPPTTFRPTGRPGNPITANPFLQTSTSSPFPEAPNACDGAVLSCCHQFEVTYDCFAVQGCPDPTSYGNPCDPSVILRVINRFQRFYGQRTG
ncbi:uncharacterized protein LOC128671290 [Plodia interpunctella]|uniref:uncharacterized protein LOC128671290 n=1 Tax=Plodia interpunctella TaxID=58824 RepID=UPI00236815C3|nr:uncharacterized protein LOC128671290 [Plodia interpunctella]